VQTSDFDMKGVVWNIICILLWIAVYTVDFSLHRPVTTISLFIFISSAANLLYYIHVPTWIFGVLPQYPAQLPAFHRWFCPLGLPSHAFH